MTTVLFRADSSINIGSGHVMRSFALAAGLKEAGCSIVWAMRDFEGNISDKVKADYPVEMMPAAVTRSDDIEFTKEVIKKYGVQVLITDAYHLTGEYLKAVKPGVRALMSIDDINDTHFYSDIVMNQNSCAVSDDYAGKIEPYTKLLLGTKYALLRDEFRAAAGRERVIIDKARNLLITLGGADPHNQTLRVLKAVSGFDLEITLVITKSFTHADKIMDYIGGANISGRVSVRQDVSDMSALMQEADLAISAGGSTCWELACTGLPNMTLVLADNQSPIAIDLADKGVSVNLGRYEDVTDEAIKSKLAVLIDDAEKRESMSEKGRALVDGLGVKRVVGAIAVQLNEYDQGNASNVSIITVTPSEETDCRLIYDWRNEETARENSLDSAVIPWEDHQRWYEQKMSDGSMVMLIVRCNERKIGYVRFDIGTSGSAEISISLDKSVRGQGLGSIALKRACDYIFLNSKVVLIMSHIKAHNRPSIEAFSRAGFSENGEVEFKGHNVLEMVLNK